MPIKKSAIKALRKSKKRHQKNISVRSALKTQTKQVERLMSAKKLDEAKTALRKLTSMLDKAVSRGMVHRNTASRKKSRLAKKLK